MKKSQEFVNQNSQRFLDELFELLRIPSISAQSEHRDDMVRTAEWLRDALLKAGADPTLANAKGVTPLQSAQQLKQQLDAKPAAERSSDLVKGTENMLKLLKAAKK